MASITGYAYLTEEQRVFRHYLERIAFSVTGRHFDICFINDGESLGFTSGEEPRTIYLAWDHPYYRGLSDKEIKFFIMGIFAHELLHQLYTDFDYTRRKMSKMPSESVASVLMKFCNTLEDPAIEHRAPEAYGGTMLSALRYTIRTIYDKAPEVSHSGSAFGELMSALIDFGDVGFVKGNFTSEEAYRAFIQIAPLYNKGINERSGKKRIDIAEQCMEIARPLWTEELKENEKMREALKELMKSLMSQMGKTSDQANPDDDDPDDDGSDSDGSDENLSPEEQKAKERREKTLEKIAEAAKELGLDDPDSDDKESGSGNGQDGSDAGEGESDDGSGNGSGSGTDKDSETGDKGSQDGSDASDGDEASDDTENDSDNNTPLKDDGSDNSNASDNSRSDNASVKSSPENASSDNSSSGNSSPSKDHGPSDSTDKDSPKKNTMRSFGLDPEDRADDSRDIRAAKKTAEELSKNLSEMSRELDKERQEMAKESRESSDNEALPDIPCEPLYDGSTAKAVNVKAGDVKDIFRRNNNSRVYAEMVARNRGKINRLTKGLKAIFETEKEECRRGTSGQYNIVRGSIATTSRIFDKRRDPGDKADTAVAIAIDCSGSMMNESRFLAARDAACILGEALRECNIPHYMFGFTADCAGADAYHVHYVTWKTWKSKKAHENLSEIYPESDNFDSYAVSYAKELLKEVPQKNKVLIVISDGLPASYAYRSLTDGVTKTSKAIKEAKKTASVCGIAIGNDADSEALQSMYGANFIHINRTEDFSNVVIKRLLKTIKSLK